MTLSLGTIPLSTRCCHCRSSPWHCGCSGLLCPQLAAASLQTRAPCAHSTQEHQQGHTAAHPPSFAAAQQTLCAGRELGTAPPHFPQEKGHDQQLSAGSSMENQDRRKSKGRVTSKKRPFEGSLLPPFQAGSFHYLSPHPAPRDLWFRDTHSHLLLREPRGRKQDITQVNRQTERKGQERER